MFAALDSDASEHSDGEVKPQKPKAKLQASGTTQAKPKPKKPVDDEEDLRSWKQKVGTKDDVLGKEKFRKFKVDLAADRKAADAANGIDAAFKQISAKTAAKKQLKKAKKKQAGTTADGTESDNASEPEKGPAGTPGDSLEEDTLEEGEEAMLARDAQQVSVEELRGANSVDASDAYQPIRSFSALGLALGGLELPKACLTTVPTYKPENGPDGGVTPSAVQSEMWGAALEAGLRDVIAISYTGSGKTLAFLVPVIHVINPPANVPTDLAYPRGLVIAPTRELVLQITQVAEAVANEFNKGLAVLGVVGGVGFEHQRNAVLTTRPRLVIATPGRLLGLCGTLSTSARQTEDLSAPVMNLTRVQVMVLDEADRLLDLGFERDIKEIATLVAGPGASYLDQEVHPQTLLTSATWTDGMTRLAEALVTPGCFKIVVGAKDLAAARSVSQRVEVLDHKKGAYRERRLCDVLSEIFGRKKEEQDDVVIHSGLSEKTGARVIVFVLFKKEADQVAALLKSHGFKAQALHGNMSQAQRTQVVGDFRTGATEVLVATDVAARGLDIPEITHVVNYSVGISVDHYIHRIGRCGRAGRKGVAYTFVMDFDRKFAPQLIGVLQQGPNEIPQELRDMASEVDWKQRGKDTRGEAAWTKGESKSEAKKELTEEQEYELECRRENREKQLSKKHANQKNQKQGRGRR